MTGLTGRKIIGKRLSLEEKANPFFQTGEFPFCAGKRRCKYPGEWERMRL